MSGNNYHYGDSASGDTDPALRLALAQLIREVQELRDQLPQPSAQLIDDSLPVLAADAAPPQERHRALLAVAAIAAAVGAVGQPVAEAANRILQMVGGQ